MAAVSERPAGADLPYLDGERVFATVGYAAAVSALARALDDGLDPELDPDRVRLGLAAGELLVMPSSYAGAGVTKLVTVGGDPRIQGVCVVFDPVTLRPAAVIDGIALTLLRTAAVSALAASRIARADASELVIFGRGPQAHAHAQALSELLPIRRTQFIGRERHAGDDELIAHADVVCCTTDAATPLFDGALVGERAAVIAIGSHARNRRELDEQLLARATVVVESRGSAMREAGDIVIAADAGALDPDALVTLRELVTGAATVKPGRPAVFKSTGMSWEDAVLASTIAAAAGLIEAPV